MLNMVTTKMTKMVTKSQLSAVIKSPVVGGGATCLVARRGCYARA